MIKIEITADSGADARAQLTALLGSATYVPTHRAPSFETVEVTVAEGGRGGSGMNNPEPIEQEAAAEPEAAVEPEKPKRTRRARAVEPAAPATEAPQISTGEERVGPEDSPEVEAQDAEDEAIESAAEAAPELTHEDIRAAIGRYVKKFGIDAAQVDGLKVFQMVCGDGVQKTTDVPADKIAKVVSGLNELLEKNPFKREAV